VRGRKKIYFIFYYIGVYRNKCNLVTCNLTTLIGLEPERSNKMSKPNWMGRDEQEERRKMAMKKEPPLDQSAELSQLTKLRKREMELERKLDEIPSSENSMEAELNYVRDQIVNLEVQIDLEPGETYIDKINRETDEKLMDLMDQNKKDVADAFAVKGSVLKGKKPAKENPAEENPMTAAEIVKRRYQDGWNDYSALLRAKRGVEEGKWGNENELYHLNARLNELKPRRHTTLTGGDPNGLDQHEPGAKLDAGKPQAGLLASDFHRALNLVIRVIDYGANKYTRSGWLRVPDAEKRYKDALYRHLLAMESEENDQESKLPHLAHAAWNALALLELATRREEDVEAMKAPEWEETDPGNPPAMNNGIGGLGPS
jgi:hypothetical protein